MLVMLHPKTTKSHKSNGAGLGGKTAETGRHMCLAAGPHEQPLLTRTSGKLVTCCCMLALCILDSLLHPEADPYGKSDKADFLPCQFYHWTYRFLQRDLSAGQLTCHCCGKLYPLIVFVLNSQHSKNSHTMITPNHPSALISTISGGLVRSQFIP